MRRGVPPPQAARQSSCRPGISLICFELGEHEVAFFVYHRLVGARRELIVTIIYCFAHKVTLARERSAQKRNSAAGVAALCCREKQRRAERFARSAIVVV